MPKLGCAPPLHEELAPAAGNLAIALPRKSETTESALGGAVLKVCEPLPFWVRLCTNERMRHAGWARCASLMISERQPSTWPPPLATCQAAESELLRVTEELPASLCVQYWAIRSPQPLGDKVVWMVEGCWTLSYDLSTRPSTPGHLEQPHAEPETSPMHHCRIMAPRSA